MKGEEEPAIERAQPVQLPLNRPGIVNSFLKAILVHTDILANGEQRRDVRASPCVQAIITTLQLTSRARS
jgi:hypothetical protein